MLTTSVVSESDWIKGISLSILASIIGGASKLAIRKSWLIVQRSDEVETTREDLGESSEVLIRPEYEETTVLEFTQYVESSSPSHSIESSSRADPLDDSSFCSFACEDTDDRTLPQGFENTDSLLQRERPLLPDDLSQQERTRIKEKTAWLAWMLRGCGLFGMTFLNPVCCVIAMNYASPSILAPFSGLTLVWIVLLSRPLIGENPSWNQVKACSLIITGEVIVAIFGDHTNDSGLTVLDVQNSYLYPPFLLYFVGLALWLLLLRHWIRKDGSGEEEEVQRRFAWGVLGGSITGLQNFLKDSLTIRKAVQADVNQGGSGQSPWYLPLMFVLAAASAILGFLCLMSCMKRYNATYSSGMFVGSFVVSASIMSAVHYQTFRNLDHVWNWFFYPLGLVILMGGVWMLVRERQTQQTHVHRHGQPIE